MSADPPTRLLFDLLHLSAVCDSPDSRLKLLPLSDLLDAIFGGLVAKSLLDRISLAFSAKETGPDLATSLSALDEAIDSAARDSTLFDRFERAIAALDTLFVIGSITRAPALSEIQALITSPMAFRFLRYLALSAPAELPIVVLAGSIASTEQQLEIPLHSEALNRLQLGYALNDPRPRWKTDLWVRLPPDPYKRRFNDWLPDELIGADTLELYRRQIPGEGPIFILATEPIAYPRSIATSTLDLRLDLAEIGLGGRRTIVYDKYHTPLLIAERIVTTR